MLNFSGNHRAFDGAEALRRSALDFDQFARHRIRPEVEFGVRGGPWIVPLMKRENTRLGAARKGSPPEVASDIQVNGSTLLLSQRAAKLFAPLMPENTEILPVEVENGENVCWIRPICLPHTLDVERSYCSGGPQFERPVLIVAQLTGAHLFLRPRHCQPAGVFRAVGEACSRCRAVRGHVSRGRACLTGLTLRGRVKPRQNHCQRMIDRRRAHCVAANRAELDRLRDHALRICQPEADAPFGLVL